MSAYSDQIILAQDANFLKRVQYSVVKSAIAIKNESAAAQYHAVRANFAGNVLSNPPNWAAQIATGIVTQSPFPGATTITGGVATTTALDSDIDNVVSSLWNSYAGAL